MNESTHRIITRLAIDLAVDAGIPALGARTAAALAENCAATDAWEDVEFIDVQLGRDHPHRREWNAVNDRSHYLSDGRSHTALNHFIDIQKGPGRFDDYDGYSYFRGSAHREQNQKAEAVTGGPAYLAAWISGFKVDEGIAFWLNDEYVHLPGQPGYHRCSPALERYSFPEDLRRYPNRRAELIERFPLASATGQPGQGVPYSIFMPVDNLARYWFERYKRRRQLNYLGPVLHAVQDASVPHHAAGYNGNWHVEYESALETYTSNTGRLESVRQSARTMLSDWNRNTARPPEGRLTLKDTALKPSWNWPVAQLVTWTALHAYRTYTRTYGRFRQGFKPRTRSQRRLLALAAAMSGLILLQAQHSRANSKPAR